MSLCLSCGFCCDGTLFDRVPLSEGDDVRIRQWLHVAPQDHHGTQPCCALEGTRCRIYDARPRTCRRFRCLLLEAHDAGEVSEREARVIVDQVRQLRAALSTLLGERDDGKAVHLARNARRTLPPAAADALNRLERALAFHFLGQQSLRRSF